VGIRGLLISVGVVFLAAGIKASIDGHLVWGIALLVSGIGMIAAACLDWALTRAFVHDPPFLITWRKALASEVLTSASAQPPEEIEILTFSVPAGKGTIRSLVFEPLTAVTGFLEIDPPEILFLHPQQPVTCTIVCVDVRTAGHSSGYGLQDFLERHRGGRMQVVARYTDALGIRRRLPFNVEIMGAHKQVEWVPGKVQKAEPDR